MATELWRCGWYQKVPEGEPANCIEIIAFLGVMPRLAPVSNPVTENRNNRRLAHCVSRAGVEKAHLLTFP